MERHTLRLTPANREKALRGIEIALAKSQGAKPWMMELREPTRSDEQNDALHGLIDQILKQRPTLNGDRMTKETYKAGFMQAMGHAMPMQRTLAGDGFFPLGLRTSKLTVSEFSDLMEFVLCWCAEAGITIEHFDGQGASGSNVARVAA